MTDKLKEAVEAALRILMTEAHAPTAADKIEQLLRGALAEQEAEPVAWGMRHSDGRIYDCIHPDEHAREPGQYTVPLYTIPPRREWQGLTDEEIEQLAIQEQLLLFCGDMEELTDIVRVVEQKLKEKNT